MVPALAAACGPAELDTLGGLIHCAKAKAPTRPEPAAPGAPPMNKLLAPGAGLVDRARDRLWGRARF